MSSHPFRRYPLVILLTALLAITAVAEPSTPAEATAAAVHKVTPDYPFEARRLHLTGTAMARAVVDPKTGYVTSVSLEQSTGHKLLDDAVLAAFRQWRFRPGSIREFRFQVTYRKWNET